MLGVFPSQCRSWRFILGAWIPKNAQSAHKRNEKMEHGQANWFPGLALPSNEISTAIAKLLAQDPNKALNHDSPTQVCLMSQTSTYDVFSFTPKDGPKTTMFLTPAFLRTAETTNCHSSLRPTSAAESPEIKFLEAKHFIAFWPSKQKIPQASQGHWSETMTSTEGRFLFVTSLDDHLDASYRSIAFFHHRWGIFFTPAIYRGLFGLALSSKWECLKPRVPPWQLQNSVGKAQDFSSPFFETSR